VKNEPDPILGMQIKGHPIFAFKAKAGRVPFDMFGNLFIGVENDGPHGRDFLFQRVLGFSYKLIDCFTLIRHFCSLIL
jgi:hypothetical protein